MLHQGIADNYHRKLAEALAQKGVKIEGQSNDAGDNIQGRPLVASVDAAEYFKNPKLAEEVFGPFSLIIRCKDISVLNAVVNTTHGQLTSTVIGDEDEIAKHKDLMNILIEKAGRLIINGVPTGVEVCPSQHHGGPYPSTTDSRFTSVGPDAVKRFIRPVAFQSFPESLLPDELKTSNPKNIWRLFNGEWKK
jgi:NADP-dependent aldehyde dehydrogenase